MSRLSATFSTIACLLSAMAVSAFTAPALAAPPTFVRVEVPSQVWQIQDVHKIFLSRQGRHVAFQVQHSQTFERRLAVFNVTNGDFTMCPPLPDGYTLGNIGGITSNAEFVYGSAIAGNVVKPVRWHVASGEVLLLDVRLPVPGATFLGANILGLSDDSLDCIAEGSYSNPDPNGPNGSGTFRWNPFDPNQNGVVLTDLAGVPYAAVERVANNGTSAFGRSSVPGGDVPVRWDRPNPNPTQMALVEGAEEYQVDGCSGNGEHMVGRAYIDPGPGLSELQRPTWWKADGTVEVLAGLGANAKGSATSVSNDGEVIVGFWMAPPTWQQRFFIRRAGLPMVDLKDFLVQEGADMENFPFNYAGPKPQVSADGFHILAVVWGTGFTVVPWVVKLDNPALHDTDEDGVPDDWETNGIPYVDADEVPQRMMLPQANPLRRNLWLEVDAMASGDFSELATDLVIMAFEGAPFVNPDGSTGVTLHIERDEFDLPLQTPWLTSDSDGCWPADFDDWRANFYGTKEQRNGRGGAGLLEARALAYRYCIVARECGPTRWGGCGGDDEMTLYLRLGMSDMNQAAVLMHELGHCLGLGHGGCDTVNGKPNHPSLMNYVFSYKHDWCHTFWRLDYTRAGAEEFAPLDETALNEHAGIGKPDGMYRDWLAPFGYKNPFDPKHRHYRFVPLNGSSVDLGSLDKSMLRDGEFNFKAQQDLNFISETHEVNLPNEPSFPQVLQPCNEWDHIVLATRAMRVANGSSSLGPPVYPTDELTWEGMDWIQENFEVPCVLGDINCDGTVNGADLGILLAGWGRCTIACPADLNNSGIVDGADLGVVLSAWTTS